MVKNRFIGSVGLGSNSATKLNALSDSERPQPQEASGSSVWYNDNGIKPQRVTIRVKIMHLKILAQTVTGTW